MDLPIWSTVTKLGMVVVVGMSNTHWVCHHWVRIINISFAYLFWLINSKKGKYPEDCMIWATLAKLGRWNAVTQVLSMCKVLTMCCDLLFYIRILIKYFICIFWLAYNRKGKTSRALLWIPPKAAYTVHSAKIACAQAKNRTIRVL